MALTASAPPSTEAEICSSLELRNPVRVQLPLDRPNIFLWAAKKNGLGVSVCTSIPTEQQPILNMCFLLQHDLGRIACSLQSCTAPDQFPKTIVFCKTKLDCVKVYNFLSKGTQVKAIVSMYHATLMEETKHFIHDQFADQASDLRCLVSTVAFGMVRVI